MTALSDVIRPPPSSSFQLLTHHTHTAAFHNSTGIPSTPVFFTGSVTRTCMIHSDVSLINYTEYDTACGLLSAHPILELVEDIMKLFSGKLMRIFSSSYILLIENFTTRWYCCFSRCNWVEIILTSKNNTFYAIVFSTQYWNYLRYGFSKI